MHLDTKVHYLIITSEFPPGPGGIGKHAYCMAKGLLHNAVHVTVVCDMDYATETEIDEFLKIIPKGIDVLRIKRKGFFTYINRIKTVLKLCKQHTFHKIIVTGRFPLWAGWLLKKFFRNQIFVHAIVHGSELLLGRKILQQFTVRSLSLIDKISTVSAYTSTIAKNVGVQKETSIIPNGIDIEEWNQKEPIQPFSWPGYPKLLTVGSVTERKGQYNVIQTLPKIVTMFPDAHYHIVGKLVDETVLRKLIESLGLNKNVTIHGQLSTQDVRRAYLTADIFCMLSEQTNNGDVEGFGIAILEAAINGVPTIASDDTGTVDAVQDGKTGYLVNSKDSDAILLAIGKILKSDRINTRQNCISWAIKHDWNLIAKELL
jgi:glycosyltransferase involved in cell wall biosynthesis